jgi:hypothetical protein
MNGAPISRHLSIDLNSSAMRSYVRHSPGGASSTDSSPSTVSSPGDVFETVEDYVLKRNSRDEVLERRNIRSAKTVFLSQDLDANNVLFGNAYRKRVNSMPNCLLDVKAKLLLPLRNLNCSAISASSPYDPTACVSKFHWHSVDNVNSYFSSR